MGNIENPRGWRASELAEQRHLLEVLDGQETLKPNVAVALVAVFCVVAAIMYWPHVVNVISEWKYRNISVQVDSNDERSPGDELRRGGQEEQQQQGTVSDADSGAAYSSSNVTCSQIKPLEEAQEVNQVAHSDALRRAGAVQVRPVSSDNGNSAPHGGGDLRAEEGQITVHRGSMENEGQTSATSAILSIMTGGSAVEVHDIMASMPPNLSAEEEKRLNNCLQIHNLAVATQTAAAVQRISEYVCLQYSLLMNRMVINVNCVSMQVECTSHCHSRKKY